MTNDKLKLTSKNIWGIVVAIISAGLCAAIDILLADSSDTESEGE